MKVKEDAGWAAERSHYSYACVNETWWKETSSRDATIAADYEKERLALLQEPPDDYVPVAHPPPHHPPPHHPPHHPHHPYHKHGEEDDYVPVAHPPPHHPPPQHPPHQPYHKEQEEVDPFESCCEVDGYGELTREAVDILAKELGISSSFPTKSFYDLVSGVGKIVMHAALAGYATTATGVEVNDGRYRAALAFRDAIDLPKTASAVSFVNGDMLDVDLSKATTIYLNQACFPADVQAKVARKIIDTAKNAHFVVAAPAIPQLVDSGLFEADEKRLFLPMEMYTYATPLTIYRRRHHQAAI